MRDMKACNIQPKSWADSVNSRIVWKQQVAKGLKDGELVHLQLNSHMS
jgi:hypothetical protein